MSSRLPALVLAAATVLALPAAAQAQERSWEVSIEGGAGYFLPLRTLGKNSATELALGAIVAELDGAPQFGGGVTVHWPATGASLRARYEYVANGDVHAQLGICGDENQPLLQGPLCRQVVSEYTSQSLGAEIRFLRGSAGSTIRPVLSLGLGVRGYEITPNPEQCNANSPDSDWIPICQRGVDIWLDDGSWAPFLRFGLGFQGQLGPLQLTGDVQDIWGRYNGGANLADGNTQNDISLLFSGSLRVF